MSDTVHISKIRFENYKGFRRFSISLSEINILTGANNGGKSTLISALRILAEGLREANRLNAKLINLSGKNFRGWTISKDRMPISTENIHSDYEELETYIEFELSNGEKLFINFSDSGECYLTVQSRFGATMNPTRFREKYGVSLICIPPLGPVEKIESILTKDRVKSKVNSPLAPRHFRNYWYHFPDDFDELSSLISRTWPGMLISRPEIVNDNEIVMFVDENRIARELFWSGLGFQIWCQILTHLVRAKSADLIVVDEPEIYLHPEIQRQMLNILRKLGPRLLIATHSTEIIGEADPIELLHIDKNKTRATRIKDVEGIQKILDAVGSVQNITLTNLAKNKRLIFVEGLEDYRIIRRFASK